MRLKFLISEISNYRCMSLFFSSRLAIKHPISIAQRGCRCVQHIVSMQAINSQILSRKIIAFILAEASKILQTDNGFSYNQSVKQFRVDRGSNSAPSTALLVEIKEGFCYLIFKKDKNKLPSHSLQSRIVC